MIRCLLVCLFVLGVVPGGSVTAAAASGGGPYFLLRQRLEAADAVVLGEVRSVTNVKGILAPDDRVAVLELSELWKGGDPANAPETLEVSDWFGPEAESRRHTPWVFFLSRTGTSAGPVYKFQAAVDLSSLSRGRRETFKHRVQQFVQIETLRTDLARQRATVRWLLEQVRDPTSREGGSFDLQNPGFHKLLTKGDISALQDLYCSLPQFDVTAGHLTDILDAVAVDRDRFIRCAFAMLQRQAEKATWIEKDLVSVMEHGLPGEEIAALAEEYRATQPVIMMRGIQDSPERRATRRDVLRRLCEAVQRELDVASQAATDVEPDAATDAVSSEADALSGISGG